MPFGSDLKPGTIVVYERAAADSKVDADVRPRGLVLQYVGRADNEGDRLIFEVIGAADGGDAWGPGHLILNDATVGLSFDRMLRQIR